jgi:hypothetical protein
LIDIPPDVIIKTTIQLGTVYYFPEESFSSSQPHYFVVINKDPVNDTVIFLVWASSKIEKVRERRLGCHADTLVEITPTDYKGFSIPSIIDCNKIMEIDINKIITRFSQNTLQIAPEMDPAIVNRLRQGVLKSNRIDNRIKLLLDI